MPWVLALGLAATFSGSVYATEDGPLPDQVPTQFHIDLRKPDGSEHTVDLIAGKLVCSDQYRSGDSAGGSTMIVTPTPSHWSAFIATLNKIHFYRWAETYSNSTSDRAVQWDIAIEISGQTFQSHGEGNFPTDGDEPHPSNSTEPTATFTAVIRAMNGLVGHTFDKGSKE